MWFIFALSSAILASFRKVNDKHLSHATHHLHLAWMNKAATLPILGLLALFTDQLLPNNSLPTAFWVSIVLSVFVTTPLDAAAYLHSLKHGQLSKTAPLHSLWPVTMLVSGALFLGQIPSLAAIIAILLIVGGVFILNTSKDNINVFRNIWHDRGTRFTIIGIGTLSLNTTVSAAALLHSSPIFYAFWVSLGSAMTQFIYAQIIAPGKFRHARKKMIVQNGSIKAISSTLYFYAAFSGPIAYVTAVQSLSSTMSAVLGARAFKEGLGRRKIVALCLISIGALALGLKA